jgi:hypothetical protein
VKRLAPVTAVILLAACSRDIQNTDAVKQSVIEYLRARTSQTGLNVDMMQVDVTSVSFQKDEAQATLYFRPKAGGGQGGMQIPYTLERKGNKWVVRGRTENGANPHGAGGMPSMPLTEPPGGAPPGQLPPGHPSVGSKQ